MITLNLAHSTTPSAFAVLRSPVYNCFSFSSLPIRPTRRYLPTILRSQSSPYPQSNDEEEQDIEGQVEDLRVPDDWLVPSKALEVYFFLTHFFSYLQFVILLKSFDFF